MCSSDLKANECSFDDKRSQVTITFQLSKEQNPMPLKKYKLIHGQNKTQHPQPALLDDQHLTYYGEVQRYHPFQTLSEEMSLDLSLIYKIGQSQHADSNILKPENMFPNIKTLEIINQRSHTHLSEPGKDLAMLLLKIDKLETIILKIGRAHV